MFEIRLVFLVLHAKPHGLSPREECDKKATKKASVFRQKTSSSHWRAAARRFRKALIGSAAVRAPGRIAYEIRPHFLKLRTVCISETKNLGAQGRIRQELIHSFYRFGYYYTFYLND